jgi:hypothetical protein
MRYLGDYADDQTVNFQFNTKDATGAPITLAGTPTVAVYKQGSTTETTTGVTLTVDYDGGTGHHDVTIVTTDAFYATASDYHVVLTAGTVSGVSQADTVLAQFSIQNRPATTRVLTALPNAVAGAADGLWILGQNTITTCSMVTAADDAIFEFGDGSNNRYYKAIGSIFTGGITSSSFAANSLTASALATDAVSEIADGVLSRNVSNVEATAGQHTLATIVLAMLENEVVGTTLTIRRTDGTTTHYTKTLTKDAAAEPITGIQ